MAKRNLFNKVQMSELVTEMSTLIDSLCYKGSIKLTILTNRKEHLQLLKHSVVKLKDVDTKEYHFDTDEIISNHYSSVGHFKREDDLSISVSVQTVDDQTSKNKIHTITKTCDSVLTFQLNSGFKDQVFIPLEETYNSWLNECISKCLRERYESSCILLPKDMCIEDIINKSSLTKSAIWNVESSDTKVVLSNEKKGYSISIVTFDELKSMVDSGVIFSKSFCFYNASFEEALYTALAIEGKKDGYEYTIKGGLLLERLKEGSNLTPTQQWVLSSLENHQKYLKEGHTELCLVLPSEDDVNACFALHYQSGVDIEILESCARFHMISSNAFVNVISVETYKKVIEIKDSFDESFDIPQLFDNYLFHPDVSLSDINENDLSDKAPKPEKGSEDLFKNDMYLRKSIRSSRKRNMRVGFKKALSCTRKGRTVKDRSTIHDSGKGPRVFKSGFQRDSDEGKDKWSLLPPNVWEMTIPNIGIDIKNFLMTGNKHCLECALNKMIEPHGVKLMCSRFEGGAKKYGYYNWAKLGPLSAYMDSLGRHLWAMTNWGKVEDDPETIDDHRGAVMWGLSTMIHLIEMVEAKAAKPELIDIPAYIDLVR